MNLYTFWLLGDGVQATPQKHSKIRSYVEVSFTSINLTSYFLRIIRLHDRQNSKQFGLSLLWNKLCLLLFIVCFEIGLDRYWEDHSRYGGLNRIFYIWFFNKKLSAHNLFHMLVDKCIRSFLVEKWKAAHSFLTNRFFIDTTKRQSLS